MTAFINSITIITIMLKLLFYTGFALVRKYMWMFIKFFFDNITIAFDQEYLFIVINIDVTNFFRNLLFEKFYKYLGI